MFVPNLRSICLEPFVTEEKIKYMTNIKRGDIKIGDQVRIVLKKDHRTNKLTEGLVKEILTKSAAHPHGIKVRLENGQVGRVKELMK